MIYAGDRCERCPRVLLADSVTGLCWACIEARRLHRKAYRRRPRDWLQHRLAVAVTQLRDEGVEW